MKKPSKTSPIITTLIIINFLLLGLVIFLFIKQSSDGPTVTNFQQCLDAGGNLAESYPLQCFWKDHSFVDDTQADNPDKDYLGLTEEAAIRKATSANLTHRILERDGESYYITSDYNSGRLNFSIRNGQVYKVERF